MRAVITTHLGAAELGKDSLKATLPLRMAFREPALALHECWGGQLYWHQGSHVGHLFAGGGQAVSERFLRGVSAEGGRRLCG
jgi:hypothetical protein